MELFAPGSPESLELEASLSSAYLSFGGPRELLGLARAEYHSLLDLLVAPARRQYDTASLGPAEFDFAFDAAAPLPGAAATNAAAAAAAAAAAGHVVTVRSRVRRTDFTVDNLRGCTLCCSLWRQHFEHDDDDDGGGGDDAGTADDGSGGGGGGKPASPRPCVVLVHDYSCARPDALPCLAPCLAAGCDVCAFDCSGAGHSTGRFASLGWFEREDVTLVVAHLQSSQDVGVCGCGPIALWGRGVGSAAVLLATDVLGMRAAAGLAPGGGSGGNSTSTSTSSRQPSPALSPAVTGAAVASPRLSPAQRAIISQNKEQGLKKRKLAGPSDTPTRY